MAECTHDKATALEGDESGRGLSIRLCASVSRYRQLARDLPGPEDTIIELGAAEGHTTCYLARRARRVIAVEKSAHCLEIARERCPGQGNIRWVEHDAYDMAPLAKLLDGADLVFIDIGGSTRHWRVLKLAGMYRHLFRPHTIVIRNVGLNDFVAAVTDAETDAPAGHWRDPDGILED